MGAVEISGLNELIYKINDCKNLTKIKEVVRANGADMNDKMKGIAKKGVAFTKGYSKGGLGGSINTTISEGGMKATVGPTKEYAPYVEHGTRFMEAEPFCEPAFNEQKEQFISDMKKVVGD